MNKALLLLLCLITSLTTMEKSFCMKSESASERLKKVNDYFGITEEEKNLEHEETSEEQIDLEKETTPIEEILRNIKLEELPERLAKLTDGLSNTHYNQENKQINSTDNLSEDDFQKKLDKELQNLD